MKTAYPLTVYFDASCKLCDSEMHNIKLHDIEERLTLVDCSAPEFDDTPFVSEGITRDVMMSCLHARNDHGEWIKGVAAFELIYRMVGMASIARLWGSPLTRPLAERAYPWVVRYRHLLSKIGLHQIFNLWSRHAARQADKRSRQCSQGHCSITR
jgi:predicted DCC family thiol-disulfide oxidoreductase YuxK